ncbi:MAG TPA: phosphate ABC transporter permease subunit PstC [Pseudomonadales bacterium]|nr:phosphate ABC transporter permease subunit PstC [Pseudomonadales bacterium]
MSATDDIELRPPNLSLGFKDRLRQEARSEVIFRSMSRGAAGLVLILLGGVMVSLLYSSWPALAEFKFDFLIDQSWNPVKEKFGALASIYGTVVTSVIAMLIAVPMSFGVAVFMTEICPARMRAPVNTAIELLAAVPSIVYGIWGLFVLGPILQHTVQPWLIDTFGGWEIIGPLFQGPPYGIGLFSAGLVLAIMVLPFITAVMREIFQMTPTSLREAAYGLGATQWQVVWDVVVPWSRPGIVGGVMLGLGRALGETMAVTFVVGNAHKIHGSILAPGTTISATIANEFTEAYGELYTSSLTALGLILFVLTFTIIAIARLMLLRLEGDGPRRV